jgi:ABC-type amino acid transport substrate-binding protein
VLRVGVDIGFPPFTYLDDSGRLTGFEIDLMNTLTSLGDFEVAYLPMAFAQLLPSLQSDEIDVAMGALTVNEERRDVVDFTDAYFGQGLSSVSYFSGGQGLAVAANSTLTGVADLGPDQRVGVKRYTTGDRWAQENLSSEIVAFATAEGALEALAAGELDGVVVDIAVIAGFLRSGQVSGVRLGDGPFTDEVYAMAVDKGQSETVDLLNRALKAAEGPVFASLIERWFGGP